MNKIKKIESIKTTVYDIIDGFRVDIVNDAEEQTYNAYVYHKQYGVKSSTFGLPYYQPNSNEMLTEEEYTRMVFDNLIGGDGYLGIYAEEYMD